MVFILGSPIPVKWRSKYIHKLQNNKLKKNDGEENKINLTAKHQALIFILSNVERRYL